MTKEELKKSLRDWLGFGEETETIEVTLKDGSKASVDKLEVGGTLTVGDAPAADGEYELEDGRTIIIAAGNIAEIKEAATEDAVEAEEEAPEAETTTGLEARVAELETKVGATTVALDELYTLIGQLTEAVREKEVGMNESIAEFRKELQQPSAEPAHFKTQNERMSLLEERVARIKEFKNR